MSGGGAQEKIIKDFTSERLKDPQITAQKAVRTTFLQTAMLIERMVPMCADRTQALIRLQEAEQWCLHAISHYWE